MRFIIKTFGCASNTADSQRLTTYFQNLGHQKTKDIQTADWIVINSCMIRKSAENRVYGLINNINKAHLDNPKKIILTGCMIGMAIKDKSGKFLKRLKQLFPDNVIFQPIEEIGFDIKPEKDKNNSALVPISFGCNNFCSFCVVPYTRGPEKSRPYEEIIAEIKNLADRGCQKIQLLGMNVNSYGADLILSLNKIQMDHKYKLPDGRIIEPVIVKHLGKYRQPTLFPFLLEDICKIKGLTEIDFMSSNPWDFSDELISVISRHSQIKRQLHLPVQSGSTRILKLMNRWYTQKDYLNLLKKIRLQIPQVLISTDIIVGFPDETQKDFEKTVDLCLKADFYKAYISIYSDREMTSAHRKMVDNVPFPIKKERWKILEKLINKKDH